MRGAIKCLLLLGMGVVCFGMPGQAQAAGQGGLAISPAALTLTLAKGSTQQTAGFTLTNHYDQTTTLHFGFEPRPGVSAKTQSAQHLTISYTDLTLAAGSSVSQTITLHDSADLAPGSQLADLVISQLSSGGGVSVLPSIRLPLALVKEDGAVSSLGLASLGAPRFGLLMPESLTPIIKNTGNVVAIPRGVITVTGPDGTIVSQGALNTASQAVSPGDQLALNTPLHKLANAYWPGVYRTSISYGLGGGQATTVSRGWFLYIAWWHVLTLAALCTGIYYGRRYTVMRALRRKPPARRVPAKRILIGRNA